MRVTQCCHCPVVIGGVEQHLAAPVAGSGLEERAVCNVVRLGRIGAQRRKIVGITVDVKLFRHLSAARAEGAPILGHLRTGLAVARDHRPVAQYGIPSKFSHGCSSFKQAGFRRAGGCS